MKRNHRLESFLGLLLGVGDGSGASLSRGGGHLNFRGRCDPLAHALFTDQIPSTKNNSELFQPADLPRSHSSA